MIVTQEIQLDINRAGLYVYAKQADDGSRYLKITMMDGNDALSIPSGASVSIRALKPDGTSVVNNGVRNSDGTATVELTSQILAVKGRVRADVSVAQSGSILSTATFYIIVDDVPLGSGIPSTNEFLQLTQLFEDVETAISNCEDAIDACEDAVQDCNDAIGNIDAAAVRTTAQTLTTAQQTQARDNIGAPASGSVLLIDANGYFYVED